LKRYLIDNIKQVTQGKISRVRAAWAVAAQEFGFRLDFTFSLSTEIGEIPSVFYLPEFGGANGVAAFLDDVFDYPGLAKAIRTAAHANGVFISFINADVYSEYEAELFHDTLLDWGCFGSEEMRKAWRA
jgi:hypothetical protein